MKFERLRLLGFKSFCESTELLIEPGLTGVVGPNGCGKSNLIEALRWVMGENSYKNMRASAMDDVIFSGGGSRPARNFAEVSLLLDNASRTAPAAFNDVRRGGNLLDPAGPGWDYATGLGTPRGAELAEAIIATLPEAP